MVLQNLQWRQNWRNYDCFNSSRWRTKSTLYQKWSIRGVVVFRCLTWTLCNGSTQKTFQWSIQLWYISYRNCFSLQALSNWLEKFAKVSKPTCIKCSSGWSLALKSYSVQTKFRFNILPFFWGLDGFNDHSAEVRFPSKGIGLWGRSQPKFQDLNTINNMG
jgi:hypothetical protein